MKENVLDILMYLFENYINDEEIEFSPDEESIQVELASAGFDEHDIKKAFAWLEGLAQQQGQEDTPLLMQGSSLRVFTEREMERLDVECRGLLLFLEQTGILEHATRELVIDRVMALEAEDISLDQLKWVILLVLFNQPGYEAAYAWMEDLVYEEMAGSLH